MTIPTLNRYLLWIYRHRERRLHCAQKWAFRHAHFRAGCVNALQNIKRKTRRNSTSAIVPSPASTTSRFLSSSPEFERQNIRIDSLEARLTCLGAAQQDAVSRLQILERSHEKSLIQLAGFHREMAKREEILRELVSGTRATLTTPVSVASVHTCQANTARGQGKGKVI
jgi:hypothetical protein